MRLTINSKLYNWDGSNPKSRIQSIRQFRNIMGWVFTSCPENHKIIISNSNFKTFSEIWFFQKHLKASFRTFEIIENLVIVCSTDENLNTHTHEHANMHSHAFLYPGYNILYNDLTTICSYIDRTLVQAKHAKFILHSYIFTFISIYICTHQTITT